MPKFQTFFCKIKFAFNSVFHELCFQYLSPFFLLKKLFEKQNDREKEGETDTQICIYWPASQMLAIEEAKTRCLELHPGFPCGGQGPSMCATSLGPTAGM